MTLLLVEKLVVCFAKAFGHRCKDLFSFDKPNDLAICLSSGWFGRFCLFNFCSMSLRSAICSCIGGLRSSALRASRIIQHLFADNLALCTSSRLRNAAACAWREPLHVFLRRVRMRSPLNGGWDSCSRNGGSNSCSACASCETLLQTT